MAKIRAFSISLLGLMLLSACGGGAQPSQLPLVSNAGATPAVASSTVTAQGKLNAAERCPVGPTTTEGPENSNTAAWSQTWYRSPDGKIWASEPGLRHYRRDGDKVLWVKPPGSTLQVNGKRLDADAPPLEADLPCCYPGDYQASGITFPTPGCWEIEATAGDTEWRFVVNISSGE